MKVRSPQLQSVRLQNFKAVRDSKTIRLSPLTVFIGNNGSGKSSIIEGLETLQTIVTQGLDEAMERWLGFEQIYHGGLNNNSKPKKPKPPLERRHLANPMQFDLRGNTGRWSFNGCMSIALGEGGNDLFIQSEKATIQDRVDKWKAELFRDDRGNGRSSQDDDDIGETSLLAARPAADGESWAFRRELGSPPNEVSLEDYVSRWQFVELNPQAMGMPRPQRRATQHIRLARDGSNIAEYLYTIYQQDPIAFNGIVETLQYVLPYASDLQPALTSELERRAYLQLSEGTFKVPGWLLSTGTLRVVALLALLRHPKPPPLIIIEEIENGLDPRTINLIVEEIRRVVEDGISQIILTTHSPYLLDLLLLEHLVLVERDNQGQPIFTRPADQDTLAAWSEQFTPGRLYTMGRLSQ